MIARISCVMGPSQLLDLVTALRYRREAENQQRFHEILLIGGTCGAILPSFPITAACKRLARLWPFDEVHDIHYCEWLNGRGLLPFVTSVHHLRRRLARHRVGEVIVCRNGQFVNELVLSAFPDTRKSCYGDCGGVDIGWTDRPHNPNGLIHVPDAFVTFPRVLWKRILDSVTIHQIPPEVSLGVMTDAGKLNLQPPLPSAAATNAAEAQVLVLTSNLLEAGVAPSVAAEIEFCYANLSRYVKKTDRVFIKGHPRESRGQSQLLLQTMRNRGFLSVERIPNSRFPIDILASQLRIKRVVSLGSTGALPFALNQKSEVVVGVDAESERRFLKNLSTSGNNDVNSRMITLTIRQAHARKPVILHYEDVATMPWNEPPFPLVVTASAVTPVAGPPCSEAC